jgi:hypothetical protein
LESPGWEGDFPVAKEGIFHQENPMQTSENFETSPLPFIGGKLLDPRGQFLRENSWRLGWKNPSGKRSRKLMAPTRIDDAYMSNIYNYHKYGQTISLYTCAIYVSVV